MDKQRVKILYAEDDKSTREFVKILFKKVEGIEVSYAVDGKEALELYTQAPFDLVATDVYMPQMDGFELIDSIKKIDPTQIFMILTGMEEKKDLVKAISLRVNLFLQKPIDTKEFVQTFELAKTIIANQKEHIRLKTQMEKELYHRLGLIKQQEKTILQQSKLAAMGEMLDAVAHQWQQPLNIIKMQADFLQMINQEQILSQQEVEETMQKIISQTNHLEETLREFRSFFRPVQNLTTVEAGKLLESVLILLKDELLKNRVKVKIEGDLKSKVSILPNEFKHVFINLINNSKDAYNDNKVADMYREVLIVVDEGEDEVVISLQDSAGGIPENMIDTLFEPHTTSKEYGTGIGLYMTKQIVNKIHGTIGVKNVKNEAVFTIKLQGGNADE